MVVINEKVLTSLILRVLFLTRCKRSQHTGEIVVFTAEKLCKREIT